MIISNVILYAAFAFFVFECLRLTFFQKRPSTKLLLLIPLLACVWIFSIIMLNNSKSPEKALNWYRMSYSILMPVPLTTHSICYQMIRMEVPKYISYISAPVSIILAILTFVTPWVIPSVSINPFVPQLGPLYSVLSVLGLFHIINGALIPLRRSKERVVLDKESDFANHFVHYLMVIFTSSTILGGFVSPWLIAHGFISKDYSFVFVSVGLVVAIAYYLLSRYIFWRLDTGGHDLFAERLLQWATNILRRLLLSKQSVFRKTLDSFLNTLDDELPLQTVMEKFSELSSCKLLLELNQEHLSNYGNAVELLSLHLSPEEWDRSSYLITAKLFASQRALAQKLLEHRVGAIFPVHGPGKEFLGQLKFDLHFCHRFFYAQDIEMIQRLCEYIARRSLAQSSAKPALVTTAPASERRFSWLRWSKRHDISILGKTIYLYGSSPWKSATAQSLKNHFICKPIERKIRFETVREEAALILAEKELPPFDGLHGMAFNFHSAVLPKGIDDAQIAEFCAQAFLLQEGLIHHSPQSGTTILSLCRDLHRLSEDLTRLATRHDPPPLFLAGDTGVGKNLFVSAFYERSGRPGNLVAVNCAAIPDTLLESEFFGYRKGAFTGATSDKKGLFEEAQGGILFLDEIGDMPHALQAKLLHVLQEKKLQPLGSSSKVDLDIWIASASKYGVQELKHRLRDDLFFRIAGISRTLPELKKRPLDIPLLAAYCFIYDSYYTQNYWACSSAWMEEKLDETWPGNARQFVQRMRSEMALSSSPYLSDASSAQRVERAESDDLTADSAGILACAPNVGSAIATWAQNAYAKKPYKLFRQELLTQHSRLYFKTLLDQTESQQEAAKLAGLSPSRLSTLLKELGL